MARPLPQQTTLEDVARAAGVSRSTASRVLAGYGAASPSARDRVATAAAQLGYAPNPAARALATGAGVRLVVAVAGPAPDVLHDPYVDRVVRAAAEVCALREVGVSLEWLPLHAPERLRRLAEDRSVRGVLILNTTERILAAMPAALDGRTVSIGIGSPAVPSFDVDNGGAARTIVGHLYESGRRRIAMISGPEWMPCTRRLVTAYEQVMRTAGLPIRLVPGDFTAAGGQAGTLAILDRWPDTDAVFANSDAMALGALAALRRRGVEVPDDIAVAGFDDVPFAALSVPALTTASHPVERIATAAVTAVLDRARVPPATAYPSELILRESA
ncbi:LacI family DNA-binding transcriptional regulator [Plantactinospora soyae]|uniref:DNA-binding LacI/PurR family transcriptional regulator n=1 Tax=Plantactinospora soyae TaxID=1544732 RepID=A0A927R1R7_9ACTN|nr:LacI family DNA-binding transcriptional regulator [Plantactinospora soyae]MBE1491702.1 DNA-binding LacI/PurR family transcriptional regulator [Plantactinospora soyae]